MKTRFLAACGAAAFAATAAFAAPVPVAKGFNDWSGTSPKNCLYGRAITPSDLRQRTVVYVVVDDAAFAGDQVRALAPLAGLAGVPASHAVTWETAELPRDVIVVFSVRHAKAADPKAFAARLRPPKDSEQSVAVAYRAYAENVTPVYKDLARVGEAEIPKEKMPYVAVFAAEGEEPAFAQEGYAAGNLASVRKAVSAAKDKLPADWTPPLGVREPQHFKKAAELVAKGKPAAAALKLLAAGIKSKDEEAAKEAQVMYDALNQYASDLKVRIALEFRAAPARAYYDFQQLVKYFPAEKKKLADIDAKLKQNKEVSSLGKVFEKLMVWGNSDFMCKNASEAKKIVAELQKLKKALEPLAKSEDTQVQGEAMLFSSQLDTLIDIIPSKVPQS